PEVLVVQQVGEVRQPDEAALGTVQAPVVQRDPGRVAQRDQPHDQEQHEERRDVQVRRVRDVGAAEPLPPAWTVRRLRRRDAGGVCRCGDRWHRRPQPTRSASSRNCSQAASGSCDPSSMRRSEFCSAWFTSPSRGPLYWASPTARARLTNIVPVGASLKNGWVISASSADSSASTWLGKVPLATNALTCCSGAVSQAASSAASSGWSVCFGTVRYEPPQLPPPPGKASTTSHVPSRPLALPSMTPRNQLGHGRVAKASVWNALAQSSDHVCRLADKPASFAVTTASKFALMASFSAATRLSSVS